MSTKKIKSQGVSRKDLKQLLKHSEITLDIELSERSFEDVYLTLDGKVILMPEIGRCREYASIQDFMMMLEEKEAQQKRNKEISIHSKKWLEKIIDKPGWQYLDRHLDVSGYYNPLIGSIYTHSDGRLIEVFLIGSTPTFAILSFPGKRRRRDGELVSTLEGIGSLGHNFLNSIPVLIQNLPALLGKPSLVLDKTVASLENIDEALLSRGKRIGLKPEIFPALIAYFGEVIRQETDSCWQIRSTTNYGEPFYEPEIVAANGNCIAPHLSIYHELYERGPFSLIHSAEEAIKVLNGGDKSYPRKHTDILLNIIEAGAEE
jgi:hypothetical protein